MAIAYFNLKNYAKTIENFNLTNLEIIKDKLDIYNKLAISYFYIKDYNKSIEYYNKIMSKLN